MSKLPDNVLQFPLPRSHVTTHTCQARCPACDSTSIARILAGMQLDGMLRDADLSGFVYAGSFDSGAVAWHCNVCDREW